MLTTLPLMSIFLAGAALLFINGKHLIPIVVFIYRMSSSYHNSLGLTSILTDNTIPDFAVFAAVYSPSLGPILSLSRQRASHLASERL